MTAIAIITQLSPAYAAVGDSGECGTCAAFPPEKAPSAQRLEEQLAVTDSERVRRLLAVDELCAPTALDCGELSANEARAVAEDFRQANRDWWDTAEKIALLILAATGLAISALNRWRPRS